MRLTNNFDLNEFVSSAVAEKYKIDNTPTPEAVEQLRILCVRVLQPLRDGHGQSMHINSGYRCPALNTAVGGVSTSQHVKGEAADVGVSEPRKLLSKLLELKLDFDQAILYPTFLHISYCSGRNRKQVLYAKGVNRLNDVKFEG